MDFNDFLDYIYPALVWCALMIPIFLLYAVMYMINCITV